VVDVRGFEHERREMVRTQLQAQGIQDPRVLEAMERIPRHHFLPPEHWDLAYVPRAVDIGQGQTISQPYMVATMTEALALKGTERVLEIGTGSGYQAAILAWLAGEVITIERVPSLAERARTALSALGLGNVEVVVGDGSVGESIEGEFDRVLVTAAAPALPVSLLQHLADPGRMVCPVGDRDLQVLHIVEREDGVDRLRHGCACRFVPLLGADGFAAG
jgi:protein-L-isoaspartate(D-aspartate) O-methyltransferase